MGSHRQNIALRILLVAVGLVGGSLVSSGQLGRSAFAPGAGHPAIRYYDPPSDAVADLNRRMDAGEVRIEFSGSLGYLESVLDALDIPVESQMAVFAKNSLQSRYIRPENPRLVYFNDSVVVAAIRGAPLVEVASVDPEKGVIFYTLEQGNPVERLFRSPSFLREAQRCLRCHESLNSLGVPGMLVRSVMPSPDGMANPQLGNYLSDHTSPLERRWGGWYVTGEHGNSSHLGNGVVTDLQDEESIRDNQELTLSSIAGRAAEGSYLLPTSDVVALLVFEHQMRMINLFTRYGWEVRYARGESSSGQAQALTRAVREVVDYMLFVDEADLPSPVRGTSGFREEFESRPPFDSAGRSLRQLDLERRLMRYPLSYMIYTDAFDGMPVEARNAVYFRMWQVLSGQDEDPRYARLSASDRRAIVEILRDTKPGLPAYFRPDRL